VALVGIAVLAAAGTPGARAAGNPYVPPLALAPAQAYAVGSWPESVAVGDFNGDGRNDVALSTSYYFDAANDFKVFLFLQQPDGSLALQARYDTDGQYGNRMGLAAGDLNGDGLTDLALATAAGVDVFLQAVGGLDLPVLVGAPGASEVEIGDLNGDGVPDLVVNAASIGLLVGNGDGTFAPVQPVAAGQTEIEVADVTGDGRADIVGLSGSVLVAPQQADGTIGGPLSYSSGGGPFVSGLAVGDVTGDGRVDVVVAAGGNRPSSHIRVLPQTLLGTLGTPIELGSYDIPEPVEVADMNGDGRSDVVTLHGGWNAAGVYLQRPDGSLRTEKLFGIPYASHYNTKGLALGDINGDGLPDIVEADYNSGLVVLRSGPTAREWGLNNVGQLGNGVTSASTRAVGPFGTARVVDLKAGGYHTLAVNGDGTVSAWGLNHVGQLGTGSTAPWVLTPELVPGMSGVSSVAGGAYHSLALRGDGTVWSWGWNRYGQLGDGTTADRRTSAQVPGLGQVTGIAAGAMHSVAVTADGSAWSWGNNIVGQLGTGAAGDSAVPVKVPGITGVTAVSAGAFHSLALKADGTVWSWGWGAFGQLGTGGTADSRVPVHVPGLSGVVAVAAGYYHDVALKADGTVWAWGLNHVGQLGNGSTTSALLPVPVAGLAGVRSIGAGAFHSLASTGATAMAWGWNAYGQLGNGSTTDSHVPVAVPGIGGVVSLSGGVSHSVAVAATSIPGVLAPSALESSRTRDKTRPGMPPPPGRPAPTDLVVLPAT